MEITWYGRACFRLKGREATVIIGRDFNLDAELAARLERVAGEGTISLSVQEPPRLALVG